MSSGQFKLIAGNSHPELAQEIATSLETPLEERTLQRFPSGETDAQLHRSVRGSDVFVVQTCTEDVDRDIMELLVLVDALHQSFASKVHAVIPHLGYARSDRTSEHDRRKPLSARLMAKLLKTAGVDHVMAFNLHSDQAQGYFDDPMDNLSATRLLREDLQAKNLQDLVIVAPTSGSAKKAEEVAGKMDRPMAVVNRIKSAGKEIISVAGDVRGSTCAIFDDMVDTGKTAAEAKEALIRAGANPDVYLYAVHPVLSAPSIERLREAAFREIVVTNTIPVNPDKKKIDGLRQVSVAKLLAKVIKDVHHDDGSASRHYA